MEVEGGPESQTPERNAPPRVLDALTVKAELEEIIKGNLELEFLDW